MDQHELDDAGAALSAALATRSPHRPDRALRDRVLRAAAARGRGHARDWFPLPALAAAAALAVLIGGLTVWGISANQALAQERSLRQQLESAAARDEVVFDVIDARNVSKVTLHPPSDDSPTAPYGKVYTRPDMPYVVAMAGRLPPAPAGQAYHLYLGGRRVGTLSPNDGGFDYFVYRADQVGIAYRQARVVLEAPQATDATGSVVLIWADR